MSCLSLIVRLAAGLAMLLGVCAAETEPMLEVRRLLEAGRELEARQLLLEIVRKRPNEQEPNLLLGQIAFSRKEFDRAVLYYKKARSLLAKDALLRVNFAEALLETKETSLADAVIQSIPAADAVAQFELGVLLARFEKYPLALRHLELARRDYPDKLAAGYNLALVQFKLGKHRECAEVLEQLRVSGFGNADVLNLLGQAYTESEQVEKALEVLQQAIQQDPRDERNYVALSKLCVDHEQVELGVPFLDRGLLTLPNSYPLLVQRAYMHLTQNRYGQAEADYRKALTIDPEADAAKIGLSLVFVQNERHREAASVLKEVIQNRPSFLAYYLLGDVETRQGFDDIARKHLETAKAMEPNFAPVHTSLGKLYLRGNEVEAAIQQFEEAVKLDPEDMTAYYQLSVAYRKTGQGELARKALESFRVLNEDERNIGLGRFLTRRLRHAGSVVPHSPAKDRQAP